MLIMQSLGHGYNLLPLIRLAFAFLALLPGQLSQVVGDEQEQAGATAELPLVYIVYVQKPEHMLSASPEEVEEWHTSFLPSPTLDSGEPRMVFSYKVVISGFAAWLTAEEVTAMEEKEGFLGAHPDRELVHQTTYSPSFLNLRGNVWQEANRGENAIIGVVDTGISPDHASFRGNPMPTPPDRWRGWCAFTNQRTCNDKLVGAKHPISQDEMWSPCDCDGHGTHVAGIAAGLEVAEASVHGSASGTAAGAAPAAYLAMYKASTGAEMLWSIEAAIADGVRTISISLSMPRDDQQVSKPLYKDDIAIGALSAVRSGIVVSCAAGNYGPDPSTVRNDAPWIMTVGASTMGRVLSFVLRLDCGADEIPGESLYTKTGLSAAIVYPGENGESQAMDCTELDDFDIAGMVVMCFTGKVNIAIKEVRQGGGIAMVLMNTRKKGSIITNVPYNDCFPIVAINHANARRLTDYVRTSPQPPQVELVPRGTVYEVAPFPAVPSFSSRGPSGANGGILKPDILGPGVNILSAEVSTASGFVLKSGTSMATPHLSGIAAILQRSHRDWTPAMIRSAIMTTAETANRQGGAITDETDEPAGLFATGAGHVNPPGALDPGLVYDLHFDDYVQYLCGLNGYTDTEVSTITGKPIKCDQVRRLLPEELNYPSISVKLSPAEGSRTAVKRTATNVGLARSDYRARVERISEWHGVEVSVDPDTLSFMELKETRRFRVTFSVVNPLQRGQVLQGLLKWVSTTHTVTSPLLVTIDETLQTAASEPRNSFGNCSLKMQHGDGCGSVENNLVY